jgi:hypothetical protein
MLKAIASRLFARRSLRVGLVEFQAVNNLAAHFYCLQQQVSAVDAHEHRVVGGHGGGCQLAIARRIQPPAAPPLTT